MNETTMDLAVRRRRSREEAVAPGRPFLLVLFGVFAAVMLAFLLIGLQGYRSIEEERNEVDAERLAYGSLVNTVKAFDAADAFRAIEYEGNDALVMDQRMVGGTYVMRLFVHDGMLMQQFSLPDADISPEAAHALFPTSTFRITYENGLLMLATDEAQPCVRLACSQPSLALSLDGRATADFEVGDA